MGTLQLDRYATSLLRSDSIRRPVFQRIFDSLHIPAGSRGLDVGCGIGLPTLMLADAVGSEGHVSGIDISEDYIEIANDYARQANLDRRVSFRLGSWDEIPFSEGEFDWVWSADAAGYAASDPLAVLQELARVVKPGGQVVLAFWSIQCLLPGYPEIEASLNATPAGIAPFSHGKPPETHYLRAMGWMRQACLLDPRAETFAGTISAPLDDGEKAALIDLFEMRWGSARVDLSPEVWSSYERLCRPESNDFILNLPDYCGFFCYSVFSGKVPL